MVFYYKCSPEEIAAAQEHARRSFSQRICTTCGRSCPPHAWMVVGLGDVRTCWVCHVLPPAADAPTAGVREYG